MNNYEWLRETPAPKLRFPWWEMVAVIVAAALVLAGLLASGQTITDWQEGAIKNGCDDRFSPVGGFAAIVSDQPFFDGTSQMVFSPAQSGLNTVFPLPNSTTTHQLRFRYLSGSQVIVAVLFRPNCGYQIIALPPTTNAAKNIVLNYKCTTQTQILFWTTGVAASWFMIDNFALDTPTDDPQAETYEQSDWEVHGAESEGIKVKIFENSLLQGFKITNK